MHKAVEPSILYLGTPVALISSANEDGSYNLAPMSSMWFLGWGCVIGLNRTSQTTINILREKECVLNLPSSDQAHYSNRLARLTGTHPVPAMKQNMGYRYAKDKFGAAGLTQLASDLVKAPRAAECPIQLEAVLQAAHPFGGFEAPRQCGTPASDSGLVMALELRIVRVHAEESLLVPGCPNHIDSDKWNPLIMSFSKYYGLAPGQVLSSELAKIPEESYRPAEHMAKPSDCLNQQAVSQ